jgi:hypothetical protein|tara:strand:+ start:943 stop:1575 length:633 start_codon:yes stop_codon:yes gene_type:complete
MFKRYLKGLFDMTKTNKNRETWLTQGITALRPTFKKAGYDIPENIRVTCGWPSKSAGRSSKRRVGECWHPDASEDQTIEMIISMVISDPIEALDILAHELVHATVGNEAGHKGPFKACALAIGLTGKMTATVAGPELFETLKTISAKLGEYPHATIDFDNRKKQSTRMIKVRCRSNDCGMIFRTSQKWLLENGSDQFDCPICHAPAYADV